MNEHLFVAFLATSFVLAVTPEVTGMLREGFTVAILNPKTALFFAALLPRSLACGPTTGTTSCRKKRARRCAK